MNRQRDRAPAGLRRPSVPAWWRDAKFGIMVHWSPASVPAFAPVGRMLTDLLRSPDPEALADSPYAEWYENSLRFPGSEVARHHRATYGDRPYADFARVWEDGAAGWDPTPWAEAFRDAGAGYVVMVAKHADGYCLWPTGVTHPHRDRWRSERDVVGELAEAVRAVGLRFGLYYCGGFDWSFDATPVGSLADVPRAVPRGEYPAYAAAQVRELIDRYRPSVLWNDVAWPAPGRELWPLLAHYYDVVPDGVVNDRWMPWSPLLGLARSGSVRRAVRAATRRQVARDGGLVPPVPPHFDHRTPEYVGRAAIDPVPWEEVRGMDGSFAYNARSRPGDFIGRDDLLWELTGVVATGGNLLLNVGPRGVDASIPDEQADRLDWVGEFLAVHGGGLRSTRPWVVPGATTPEGTEVRYTARGEVVHAFLRSPTTRATLAAVRPRPGTEVTRLDGGDVDWTDEGGVLVVSFGPDPTDGPVVGLALRRVEARGRASVD